MRSARGSRARESAAQHGISHRARDLRRRRIHEGARPDKRQKGHGLHRPAVARLEIRRHAAVHGIERRAHQRAGEQDEGRPPAQRGVELKMSAPYQGGGEQNRVRPAGKAGGDGDADMADYEKQRERAADVDGDGRHREPHRRPGVLAGEKAGQEHLRHHEGGQAAGKSGQSSGDLNGIGGGEGAALEKHLNDGLRDDDERDRGGQREEEREFEAPVLACRGACLVMIRQMPRQRRQEDHADGDSHHAERKLVDAVGIVQERNGARLERGDHRADKDVHLIDAARHKARPRKLDQPIHLGRQPRPAEAGVHAKAARRPGDHEKLRKPCDCHAPGLDDARLRLVIEAACRREQRHGDQDKIEDDGGRSGRAEFAERVQNPGRERDERHADEVGEGDARQEHCEPELLRIGAEAGRDRLDEIGHEDFGGDHGGGDAHEQDGERFLREAPRTFPAFTAKTLREKRHEGRIERAFGEKRPEQVGEAERHEKGVGHPARAHDGGQQHVAGKSEDPADRRQSANRQKPAIKAHAAPLFVFKAQL